MLQNVPRGRGRLATTANRQTNYGCVCQVRNFVFFTQNVLTENKTMSRILNKSVLFRFMSEHKEETDEEFYSRYEAYFNRSDIDGWEARKAINDLAGQDAVADPSV